VVDWGRFLAARTEQELEELAMTDPTFDRAKEALEVLSADPEAQDLAHRRQLALWETRRQEGLARAEGEASGLRQAVLTACELLGIDVDARRQAEIDSLEADGLAKLLARLRQDRCWPSE
jgi:hypothetical protein